MYYCESCKKFVNGSTWESESPNHRMRETSCGGGGFYREVRCEECGGNSLEEAYNCEVCGEPTLETYCDWCMSEAMSVAKAFIGDDKHKAELLEDVSDKIWMELHKLESSKPKSKVKHI